MTTNSIPELPVEVVTLILSKLDVISLVKATVISKEICNIIRAELLPASEARLMAQLVSDGYRLSFVLKYYKEHGSVANLHSDIESEMEIQSSKGGKPDIFDIFDFDDTPLIDALRMFGRLFTFPSSAQAIDRLVEALGRSWARAAYNQRQPRVYSADTAYVLCYSLIMLSTDLHHDAVKNKMTLENFLRANKGLDEGRDLPIEFLTDLYNDVKKQPIIAKRAAPEGFDDTASGAAAKPSKSKCVVM